MIKKLNILLINTNTLQLRTYATFLNKKGLGVLVASQFNQGKEIAEKKLPELIVVFVNEKEETEAINIANSLTELNTQIIISYQNNKGLDKLSEIAKVNVISDPEHIKESDLFELCLKLYPNFAQETKPSISVEVIGFKKSRPNILLIEDNSLNQIYFGEILNKLAITYTVSEGIVNALEEIKRQHFDLIISDVKLNDGNGIVLMNELKEQSYTQPPFIFISGYSKAELEQLYGSFQAYALLTKPIEEQVLVKAIENCLKMTVGATEAIIPKVKTYNYEKIYQILKNDPAKISKSIQEFHALIFRSIISTSEAIQNQEFEKLRGTFHDLLNLCTYFGAEQLFELIMSFRKETDLTHKIDLLEQINTELKCIGEYSQSLEKSGASAS